MRFWISLACSIWIACSTQDDSSDTHISTKPPIDSVEFVANQFIWEKGNKGSGVWVVEEPDIFDIYSSHLFWVGKYFPKILDRYDFEFQDRVLISCYLYLVGQEKYLRELQDQNLTDEQKRVLKQHTGNFNIELD